MATESTSPRNRIAAAKTSVLERRESSVLVGLIAIIVLGAFVNPSTFLRISTFMSVLRGAAVISMVGYGVSLLMVTGEFDLSVGSLVAITAGLTGVMVGQMGIDSVFAVLLVITLATIYGVTQGLLVTKFGLPSLIVTIGTLTLLRGAHFLILGGQAVTFSQQQAGPLVRLIGGTYELPFVISYQIPGIHNSLQTYNQFSMQIVWMLVFLVIFHWILFRTTFGRHVRATGDNIHSVETTGVDADRVKIASFGILAAITAFAGISKIAYVSSVSPGTGDGIALIAIAAVVLGGTKLTGGEGTMVGVVMGALILGFAQKILTLSGFGAKFNVAVTGLFIIAAISLDTIFAEFSVTRVRDWYTRPLGRMVRGPRTFFAQQIDEKGPDEALAFLGMSVFATGILVSLVMLVVDLVSPAFGDRFQLYIAEANLSGAVIVLLQLYLIVALFVLLALIVIDSVAGYLGGSGDFDDTLSVISYGMAPLVLLAVPLLLYGFGFLTILVLATLLIVAVVIGAVQYYGLVQLHELSGRHVVVTLTAVYVVWLLVSVYVGTNLA